MPRPFRRILVYYPNSIKNTPIEVPLLRLQQRGHHVCTLTMTPKGGLHDHYENIGIPAFSAPANVAGSTGPTRFWRHGRALAHFCNRNRIDVVFSHLQPANAAAMLAQHFTKAKIFPFRHHFQYPFLSENPSDLPVPRQERLLDRCIHWQARHIVVPGSGVRNGMIRYEGANPKKISIIPYIYEFDSMLRRVDAGRVAQIKAEHPARFLLVVMMRHMPFKRHPEAFEVLRRLLANGVDARMMVLDHGMRLDHNKQLATEMGIAERTAFLGFQQNVFNFLAAADIHLHPSLSEASNSAVKEAGLVGTPSVAVRGVGDFDDYIQTGQSGFLVDGKSFADEAVNICLGGISGAINLNLVGQCQGDAVRAQFTARDEVVDMYERLLQQH